jgi:hypothetical protein
MINKLSNSTVSNILKKRSHDKRVLFFENVILNDIKKLFEQVMPNVSNTEKPKSWEEFEELLKQQTKLDDLPPEFKKMAKRKWEEASKLEEKLKSGDADSESLMKEVEGKETAYTASTFFQQAGERVSELATDPETYKMLALGVLLTLAFPVAAPIVVIGGTALAASSAISQASEGDYGAAAVDTTLGILPFGSKSVRGSFVPRSRTQISPRTRIQQPSKQGSAEAPKDLTRPESLDLKPKELGPFVAPETKYKLSAEQMADLEPLSQTFAGWKMNPWEAGSKASEFIEPKRQGMPGTAVRSDTPAGYRRISPFNLTKKEIARIEKFGNVAEKEALARARQKQLGKAIGGSVGERIQDSDTPFMKAVIDRYTALNNARVPETAEAGEYLSLSGSPNPSFVRHLPPRISSVPVIPQRPWAFGSLESYQEAVSKQLDRPLNKEELTYTEKVYNEDVKRRRIETQEREIRPDFDVSQIQGKRTEEKGPIRKAAEKTASIAATASAAAESTPVYPEALTVKPPPPIVSRANLPRVKQYEYTPEIPTRTRAIERSSVYPSDFSSVDVSSSPLTVSVDSSAGIPNIPTIPVDMSPDANVRNIVASSLTGSRSTAPSSSTNVNTASEVGGKPIVGPSTKSGIKTPLKLPGFPFEPKPFTDDGSGAGSVGRLTNQDIGIALDRIIGQRSGAYRIR